MHVVGSQGFVAPGMGGLGGVFGLGSNAELDAAPPSTYAVTSLVRGEPGALIRVVGLTAARSLFIAPGIYVAAKAFGWPEMTGWKLAGAAVITSISLSAFMCGWYWYRTTVMAARTPGS